MSTGFLKAWLEMKHVKTKRLQHDSPWETKKNDESKKLDNMRLVKPGAQIFKQLMDILTKQFLLTAYLVPTSWASLSYLKIYTFSGGRFLSIIDSAYKVCLVNCKSLWEIHSEECTMLPVLEGGECNCEQNQKAEFNTCRGKLQVQENKTPC